MHQVLQFAYLTTYLNSGTVDCKSSPYEINSKLGRSQAHNLVNAPKKVLQFLHLTPCILTLVDCKSSPYEINGNLGSSPANNLVFAPSPAVSPLDHAGQCCGYAVYGLAMALKYRPYSRTSKHQRHLP
ncbi:uncharacterized protein [Asterias amurensis]|uniref:uncharacterized protein n=1 Tax=Asterias amurensis TaxID=7602 RepID=UPI003AB7D4B1